MAIEQEKLTNLYKAYDNAPHLDAAYFHQFEGKEGEKKFKDLLKSGNAPQKIVQLEAIVKRAWFDVQKKLESNNVKMPEVELSTSLSPNLYAQKIATKIDVQSESSGQVKSIKFSLNLNAQDFLKLPAQEIYTIASATFNSALVPVDKMKLNDSSENESEKYGLYKDEFEKQNILEGKTASSQEGKTQNILIEYIKEFLREFFMLPSKNSSKGFEDGLINATNKQDAEAYYEMLAGQVVLDMTSSSTAKEVASTMFDEKVFEGKTQPSTIDIVAARNEKLSSVVAEAESSGDFEKSSEVREQITELLSIQTKEDFETLKNTSVNGNFDKSSVRNFCESYVAQLLNGTGLENSGLEITFNSNGVQGQFQKPNKINIDLSQVESVTDLAMCIAHETRHFKDSKFGSSENQVDRKFRWKDYLKSDVSQNSEEFAFMQKLHKICYHLDPEERNGRMAELEALKFMNELSSGDLAMSAEVSRNIDSFNVYQEQTIAYAEALESGDPSNENSYEALYNEYLSMKPRLSSKDRKIIETRLQYLKDLKKQGINLADEKQSTKTASSIKTGTSFDSESFGPQM